MINQAYYSILRWASDATRDEARNVAVVLVDPEGQFGGVRAAPVSSISANLREQGVLDAVLLNLSRQFDTEQKPDLSWLREMAHSMRHSIYFTEPRPAAASDVDSVLQALYRAYVSPRPAPRAQTKGVVLDRVVNSLRRRGFSVRRGEYIGDFIFDAIVQEDRRAIPLEVLSFATQIKDWAPAERDAGHFLYGLSKLQVEGQAVVQPPSASSTPSASVAYDRVTHWFQRERVPVMTPDEIANPSMRLPLE